MPTPCSSPATASGARPTTWLSGCTRARPISGARRTSPTIKADLDIFRWWNALYDDVIFTTRFNQREDTKPQVQKIKKLESQNQSRENMIQYQ